MIQNEPLERELQPGDRLVLWLPVFAGLGIGCYFNLAAEPSAVWLWVLFLFVAFAVAGSWQYRVLLPWRYGAACALLFAAGMLGAQLRTQSVHTHLVTEPYFNADVHGVVGSVERINRGWRVLLRQAHIEDDKQDYTLRLSLRGEKPFVGQAVHVKANILPPSPPLLPGMYDFQLHAFFQGVSGYGYTSQRLDEAAQPESDQRNWLDRYRAFLAGRVYQNIHQPDAGITAALLNGQRGGIDRKTTQNMQQSGLYHIISISGVHITLMAGIVFFVVRFLLCCNMSIALRWPVKKIAALVALCAILLYMLAVGADPATARAVIVAAIALVAIMLDREPINLRLVALAALFLMALQPECVLDIGFQLSFAAVTALVAFYQHTQRFWLHSTWREGFILRLARPIFLAIVTSLVATVATAPLVLLHFQQIPLLSMLANALAMPVVDFIIMPGTFLCYLLTPLPLFGGWVIKLMGWGVGLLMQISTVVSSMKMALWRIPAIPADAVILLMVALFLLIVLRSYWRFVSCGFMAAGFLLLAMNKPPGLLLTDNRMVLLPDRDTATLYTDGAADSFSKNLLQQQTGTWKTADFSCDTDPCYLTEQGRRITLVHNIAALDHACDKATDIIITRYYLDHPCAGALILDRHRLRRMGGQAVDLKTLAVETVYDGYARRPWQMVQKHNWPSRPFQPNIKGNGEAHDRDRTGPHTRNPANLQGKARP